MVFLICDGFLCIGHLGKLSIVWLCHFHVVLKVAAGGERSGSSACGRAFKD